MSAAMEQQPQHPTRPRSKSTFSFKSDKSHHSQPQSPKHEKRPSYEDRHKSHYDPSTKTNPNSAMNEAQPSAAALEKPTLQSLRSFQHLDPLGNPIEEPDLSNPTRSRWERPLDTIRSFEAAIDNEYRRRAQTMRGDSDAISGYGSRRSSYYGGQNRFSQFSGHFGGGQTARDSYMDGGHAMGGPVGPPRTRYSRMQTDPGWNSNNRYSNGYSTHGYQQSRDTVNTNGSNGSHSEPYSNDPSENSSIERAMPVSRPDLGEQYGFQGFGGEPILEEYGSRPYYPPAQPPANGANIPPPVPAKTGPPPPVHNPIKLNSTETPSSAAGNGRPKALSRNNTEKRKSWFKRRFSKD